jgi:hypothetical protein
MKKYIIAAAVLLLTTSWFFFNAPKHPQTVNTWYKYWGVSHDSVMQAPRIITQPRYRDSGDIYYNKVDSNLYWYTGHQFRTFSGSSTKLDSAYNAAINLTSGDTNLFIVAGTIRPINTAGVVTWEYINDALHKPIGMNTAKAPTASTSSSQVNVYYSQHASKIITFVTGPDETLSAQGIQSGSSVDPDSAKIYLWYTDISGGYAFWDSINAVWTNVNLSWFGAPPSISYNSTTGELDLNVNAGGMINPNNDIYRLSGISNSDKYRLVSDIFKTTSSKLVFHFVDNLGIVATGTLLPQHLSFQITGRQYWFGLPVSDWSGSNAWVATKLGALANIWFIGVMKK